MFNFRQCPIQAGRRYFQHVMPRQRVLDIERRADLAADCFAVLQANAFRPVDEFKAMMDEMIQELHATPPEPGADRVLVAGDPEFDAEAERRERGIPLHTTQYEAIVATARRVGAQVFI